MLSNQKLKRNTSSDIKKHVWDLFRAFAFSAEPFGNFCFQGFFIAATTSKEMILSFSNVTYDRKFWPFSPIKVPLQEVKTSTGQIEILLEIRNYGLGKFSL